MKFVLLKIGDRVRMTDQYVKISGGPRLSGIIVGYASWHGMPGLVRVKHDADGSYENYSPLNWQRESDGCIGKVPSAEEIGQMNAATAIQTRYNGILYRSRTEARWSVFWERLSIIFEYEKEGYELTTGPYLPDFWLPQYGMFAEVKPTTFSPLEKEKCAELATLTGNPCLMLDGAPRMKFYYAALPDEGGIGEERPFYLTVRHDPISDSREFHCSFDDLIFKDTHAAVTAAMSARFEHGQSGAMINEMN